MKYRLETIDEHVKRLSLELVITKEDIMFSKKPRGQVVDMIVIDDCGKQVTRLSDIANTPLYDRLRDDSGKVSHENALWFGKALFKEALTATLRRG